MRQTLRSVAMRARSSSTSPWPKPAPKRPAARARQMAEGSIRQRSAGSWEIKYDLGRDPQTSKRITKFKTVRGTKRDAQKELRRLLTTVDTGTHGDPGKLTVAEWLAAWQKGAKENVSPTTWARYPLTLTKQP